MKAERWAREILGDGPDLETIVQLSRARDRLAMDLARRDIAGMVRAVNPQPA